MSLEDLMSLSHCPCMKETIGKTRFGHEIWIEFAADSSGEETLLVVQFESHEEQYDTLCVIEAYDLRLDATGASPSFVDHSKALKQIQKWIQDHEGRKSGPAAFVLGHIVSTDRLRYGLKLIHPAYRSSILALLR